MNTRTGMKIIFAFLLLALFSPAAAGQSESIEKDFTANIKKYKLEKYSMGEDASSGFDYLIYKNKAEIVKIRIVWSSSSGAPPRAEDFYYKAGVPVLYADLSITKRQVRNVVKGITTILPAADKCYFKDGKMVSWIEKGKAVSPDDNRWTQMGSDAFTLAKDTLDFYPELKEN